MTAPHGPPPDGIDAAFASTMIIEWDRDGRPHALTGPWAVRLPATVHVVTSANPHGLDVSPSANTQALRRLIDDVDGDARRWSPAVGASPDGAHHELSLVLGGLTRRAAVDLGRRHGQIAIFELTDETLTVVSCRDDSGTARPRRASPDGMSDALGTITLDQVIAWRDEHELASGRPLDRTHSRCAGPPIP